jgi:hypothetical protein
MSITLRHHGVVRLLSFGLTVVLLVIAMFVLASVYTGAMARGEVGYDASLYMSFPSRLAETGSFYHPSQFSGPYPAEGPVNLYPPLALYLFASMAALPRVLWWVIPLGVLVVHAWHARPAWWTWPLIAGCLATVPAAAILVYGNSDMWAAAFIAMATWWSWPATLLAFKPILIPIALLWVGSRRWWIAAAAIAAAAIPLWPIWPEWFSAITNVESTLFRNVNSLTFLAIPVIVYLGRTRLRPGIPRSGAAHPR